MTWRQSFVGATVAGLCLVGCGGGGEVDEGPERPTTTQPIPAGDECRALDRRYDAQLGASGVRNPAMEEEWVEIGCERLCGVGLASAHSPGACRMD